jgi:hypothetical protein
MSMLQPRKLVLAAALVLTLAAMYLVNAEEPEEDLTAPRAAASRPRLTPREPVQAFAAGMEAQVSGLPDLARSRAQQAQAIRQPGKDLWQTHTWQAPPPPLQQSAAALAEAARPVTPALPYQYMGQMDDGPGGQLVFLTAGNRVFNVSPGQTLEQVWRLDSMDQRALYLTYLPLNSAVVLSKTAKPVVALAPSPDDQPTDR